VYLKTILSFWWLEVEILQQYDDEKENFLTSKFFTGTRALACNKLIKTYEAQRQCLI